MTQTSAQRDENRLSADLRNTMRDSLAMAIIGYGSANAGHYVGKWADVPALERIAAHSIGCSAADLRDSENAEIRSMVLAALKLA